MGTGSVGDGGVSLGGDKGLAGGHSELVWVLPTPRLGKGNL